MSGETSFSFAADYFAPFQHEIHYTSISFINQSIYAHMHICIQYIIYICILVICNKSFVCNNNLKFLIDFRLLSNCILCFPVVFMNFEITFCYFIFTFFSICRSDLISCKLVFSATKLRNVANFNAKILKGDYGVKWQLKIC